MYADVSTQDKKKLIGRQKYTLWKQDKILANYTEFAKLENRGM